MIEETVVGASSAPAVATVTPPVVVKLGRQSKKRIKQLTKGRGRLLDKVMDAIAEMQRNGTVVSGAQPVIIVVKEERRGFALFD
jgi:hypothetical protein